MKSFTIHICNPETSATEMDTYLNKRFGPSKDKNDNRLWYLGRNYDRLYSESLLEITFQGDQTAKHSLMMLEHPYTLIDEIPDDEPKVVKNNFLDFFEEDEVRL